MDRMTRMVDYSIIVPLLGRLSDFEDTLASVLRHRPKNSQILVAHDGRYDDPYDLRREVDFVIADNQCELAGLMNRALPRIRGEITVVVRPGMDIDENFEQPLADSFADPTIASVCPLIVTALHSAKIVAAGVDCDRTCTRRLIGCGLDMRTGSVEELRSLGPTSWLAAYRTDALRLSGPFDERLETVFLDLEIALALKGLGLRSTLNPDFVGTLESATAMLEESKTPHGLSAERAKTRHRLNLDSSTIKTCLFEVTQIPRSPWKLRHLAQRVGARRMRAEDESFSHSIRAKRDMLVGQKLLPNQSLASGSLRRAA